MINIKLALLANENEDDHINWCNALEEYKNIEYQIINLSNYDWFEKIKSQRFDYLLAKPPGQTSYFKQLYDERIYLIDNVLNLPIYPTPSEIYIYENKRFFYSWLKANGLPHPKTYIFYSKKESLDFIEEYEMPLVAKYNIGASGSGVKVLKSLNDKIKYINDSFSSGGAPKRWGPNLEKRNIIKRGFYYINNPDQVMKKLTIYNSRRNDVQRGFVILQEYIEHDYEWRIVVIGDSFFAHKKLKINEKASGSLLKNYDNPPPYLFDFASNIMGKYNFTSQAIDVFERVNGELLINEMQCIFGQSDPHQMLIDGKPGRYRNINGTWNYEEGDFNKNESYNLRIEHILKLLIINTESN